MMTELPMAPPPLEVEITVEPNQFYTPKPNALPLDATLYPLVVLELDPFVTRIVELGVADAENRVNQQQFELHKITVFVNTSIQKLEVKNFTLVNKLRELARQLEALKARGGHATNEVLDDIPDPNKTVPKEYTEDEVRAIELEKQREVQEKREEAKLKVRRAGARLKNAWRWIAQNCHPDRTKDKYLQSFLPGAVYLKDNNMVEELEQMVGLLKNYKLSPNKQQYLASQKARRQALMEHIDVLKKHKAALMSHPSYHIAKTLETQGEEVASAYFQKMLHSNIAEVSRQLYFLQAQHQQDEMIRQWQKQNKDKVDSSGNRDDSITIHTGPVHGHRIFTWSSTKPKGSDTD